MQNSFNPLCKGITRSEKRSFAQPGLKRKATVGKVVDKLGVESLGEEINLQAVIEFYSR